MAKILWITTFLFGVVGTWLLRVWEVPLETRLAAGLAILFAGIIGMPIGWIAGHFLSRASDVDAKGYRVIAWGNLVAWLIPVVGMTLSTATYLFSRRSDTSQRLFYILSWVGSLLASANAVLGTVADDLSRKGLEIVQIDRAAVNAEMDRLAVTQIRSFERCPYAAIEGWSQADVDTHCRRLPDEGRVRAMELKLQAETERRPAD